MFQGIDIPSCNHEGSVIVSCATSINLNLIQPHSELYSRVPKYGRLIYSCADDPGEHKYKKMKLNVSMSDNTSKERYNLW